MLNKDVLHGMFDLGGINLIKHANANFEMKEIALLLFSINIWIRIININIFDRNIFTEFYLTFSDFFWEAYFFNFLNFSLQIL